MAVTPMKLVTIVGPLHQFDTVLRGCVINQEFHPQSAAPVSRKVKHLYAFDEDNPYTELLIRVEDAAERAGIGLDFAEFKDRELTPEALAVYLESFQRRITAMEEEKARLGRQITENGQIIFQLEHMKGVNVEISDFFSFTYVKFRYGYLPRERYISFLPLLQERGDVFFFPTTTEHELLYGIYFTTREAVKQVDALFDSLQFERVHLSGRIHGVGEDAIANMMEETRQAKARLQEIDRELAALCTQERETFLAHYSYIRFMKDTFDLRRYAAHTGESFYMLGWVPAAECDGFVRRIAEYEGLNCVASTSEPGEFKDYAPPTKLRNAPLFQAFEPFVAMYGLPAYNEMDPTPMMAVSYTLLFGVMFGDVGQGALLALLGYLVWKLKGLWLGRVISWAGMSSVVFGFIYGSVFGNEHWLPGFKVLESSAASQRILMITIYGGAIMLSMSILVNVFNGFRQKNLEKSIFGPNGLAGLALYWSIILIVLPFIGFGRQTVPTQVLVLCILVLSVLVFLREPLGKLAARREDWRPHESIGDFVMTNVFEMFESLLAYVTNTISFLRVGAYAISHASMMVVVYSLAKGAGDTYNIIGLALGNLIVVGIEGLLVGIQVLRLEFYELFGRFFSGEGRAYNPVIINYKSRDS